MPAVVPREGGGPSTPRPLGSNVDVSGVLDRPVKPGDDIRRVGRAKRNPPILARHNDGFRFALPILHFLGAAQFTALLIMTSISLVLGRLKAEDNTLFSSPGSLTLIASRPSDLATPEKSTGGSTKSMPM